MDDNSIFKIPMSNSVADIQEAKINTVEISAAPYKYEKQNAPARKSFEFYDELTAISEEVMSCRNATLGRA